MTNLGKLGMTKEEGDLLREVMIAIAPPGREGRSFGEVLNKWINFVGSVERGYRESIYEYKNDLSIRNVLQDVLERLPAPAASKISAVVLPWDRRFIEATVEVNGTPATMPTNPEVFWRNRIPKVLTGELAEDLRSEGIV